MNWISIKSQEELNKIIGDEEINLIFKHSCRCGTSFMALDKLENEWSHEEMEHVNTYFVDVIEDRMLARSTETIFGISHQSPQVLVVHNGECLYENSHSGINYEKIKQVINGELLNQNA